MGITVSRLKTGKRLTGFTLVEMITVLLLVSILAVVGLSRYTDQSAFSEWGFTEEVTTALRYAQKFAMASGCDTAVMLTTGSFQLRQRTSCKAGGFEQPVFLPGGNGDYSGNAPNGITVTDLDLYFDSTGRPRDVATGALTGLVSSISVGSGSILIEPETGYVRRP